MNKVLKTNVRLQRKRYFVAREPLRGRREMTVGEGRTGLRGERKGRKMENGEGREKREVGVMFVEGIVATGIRYRLPLMR